MVNASRPASLSEGAVPLPNHPLGSFNPQMGALWESLLHCRKAIMAITAIIVTIAIVYLAVTPYQFTATGLVLIDTKGEITLQNTRTITDANVESANIETQVEVMKSDRILRQVVEEQHLIDDPALLPGPLSQALKTVINKLEIWKRPATAFGGEDPKLIGAIQALKKLVSIKRVGLTYVIEITATLPRAAEAAAVVNAYAQAFIEDQQRRREAVARRTSELFQSRADELESQAQKSEQAVEQLKFSGSQAGENSAAARVTLKKLESEASTYRTLHDKFLEQSAETWQQQFLSKPDAQSVSPALVPLSKSSPNTLVTLASALTIGLSLGVLYAFLRERNAVEHFGITGN